MNTYTFRIMRPTGPADPNGAVPLEPTGAMRSIVRSFELIPLQIYQYARDFIENGPYSPRDVVCNVYENGHYIDQIGPEV